MTSSRRLTGRKRHLISVMAISLLLATFASAAQADNHTSSNQTETECLTEHTVLIASDTETMVTAGNTGAPVPHPAALAWEPRDDTDPSHWDLNVDYNFEVADWIWES